MNIVLGARKKIIQKSVSIIVPCYNEEEVLPESAEKIGKVLDKFVAEGRIALDSRIIFVDDGSNDGTWDIIENLSRGSQRFAGIKLSRNRGHQNALLSGLLNAGGEVLISIDADLQDDLDVIDEMLRLHEQGAEIVLGVRQSRETDTVFKRYTAEIYYKLMRVMGANVVFNHADYRLMSRRAVEALREFGEVNLFLRGIIPLLGFTTRTVMYERKARIAGTSKYPLSKMLGLAAEGITSFSVLPLRWITVTGMFLSIISALIGVWAILVRLLGSNYVPGWASTVAPMYFLGGIQLLSLGIIGEYIGKTYMETKRRPRFILEKLSGRVNDRINSQSTKFVDVDMTISTHID